MKGRRRERGGREGDRGGQ